MAIFIYPTIATDEKIGARIRALRDEMGLSQEAFGERVGASRQRIGNWEQGKRRPDLDAALRICEITGATLDYLVLGRAFTLPSELRDALYLKNSL